jgi:hypothetical protein
MIARSRHIVRRHSEGMDLGDIIQYSNAISQMSKLSGQVKRVPNKKLLPLATNALNVVMLLIFCGEPIGEEGYGQ